LFYRNKLLKWLNREETNESENVNERPCIEPKQRNVIIANMQWLEEKK